MGGKKKAGGGKKKKDKEGGEGGADEGGSPALVLPTDDTCWVTLDMQLVNWAFLNFKLRVKTTTPLYSIKKKLVERHGRMIDLRMWKEYKIDANELTNEMATLEDVGIVGAGAEEDVVTVPVIYDFKPYAHDDPLLLVASERPLEEP